MTQPVPRNSENLERTREYFDSWQRYHAEVETWFSELYANCGRALTKEISGRVLDIGSGGVLNYDIIAAKQLVAIDYSVKAIDLAAFPKSADLVQGDGTRLPFASGSFDCVVMQFLIHHLAKNNYALTLQNVDLCLNEAHRVLRPGGKMLIMESFVPGLLEWGERTVYPFIRWSLSKVGQPMVFQFSVKSFERIFRKQSVTGVEIIPVSIGRYISQFGLKVPGYISPCQIRLVKGVKSAT